MVEILLLSCLFEFFFFLQNHYRDRPLSARGRNQVPVRSPRNNGRSLTPLETTVPEKSGQDLYQVPTVNHGGGMLTSSGSPVRKAHHNGNGAMPRPDRAVEFGSFGHLQLEPPVPIDCSREPNPVSVLFQNSAALNVSSPKMQKAKHPSITDQDRYEHFTTLQVTYGLITWDSLNCLKFLFFLLNM